MKKLTFYLLLTLIAVACDAPSGRFRLQGRFRSFNQGEFYIYSLYASDARLDTIHVLDGRFNYETDIEDTTIFSLIFPNFSEVPVFAHSGANIKMEGDASHLREIDITGTKENEAFTQFRQANSELTPPQLKQAAADYVRAHPQSLVSFYLVNRYFIQSETPDYRQASQLVGTLLKATPDDVRLQRLAQELDRLKNASVQSRLPQFAATDTKGRSVANSTLSGELNVVYTWASWNFESQNIQRQLKSQKQKYGSRLALVGICLDARLDDCQRLTDRDTISWSTVCDGQMWGTPVLRTLGLAYVPGNIVTDRSGKVIAVNLDRNSLKEKIESILK